MGQKIKEKAHRQLASGCPLEAHVAAHLHATHWLRVGCPPWDGWPLEVRWRVAGAMFVGYVEYNGKFFVKIKT